MGKRVNHAYPDLAKPLRSTDRTVLAANRREKPQQHGKPDAHRLREPHCL